MYQLERIVLNNWGRLDPQDIDIRGSTAILGPTGTGKSTIVDALQVIITGASSRYFDLNKSTGGQNARTIRDYCLGADDHISPDAPKFEAAESLVALAFRDRVTGTAISIGLLFSASVDESHAAVRSRFVAPGYAIRLADLLETRSTPTGDIQVVPTLARIQERLKQLCPKLRQHGSGIAYVDDYLHAMRPSGAAPDSHQVLRNFKQSVAFQPINDPTEFIRRHILEESNIDVEALKGSIERYRFLEQEVVRREEQLAEITEARRRLQSWAQHLIRHNVLRFTMAHAERRRLDSVIERLEARRLEIAREVERESGFKRRHLETIEQYQDDRLRQKALLMEVPEAVHTRALEADHLRFEEKRAAARMAIAKRVTQLARLADLVPMSDRVPMQFADCLAAVGEFLQLVRGKSPENLSAIDVDLANLEKRIVGLVDAEGSLSRQLDVLMSDVAKQRAELDALEGSLKISGDGPLLSAHVREFMRLLEGEGIVARPLPDLVDISEPAWAMALEMLLGPHREALLVPLDRVADAYGLLYRERHRFHACRLIDTRKTARWHTRLDERSIATILVTQDPDARAFIERQVGRFLKAETERDLEELDQAITKRGKTTQGMALRVYRDLTPILGKTAQAAAVDRARRDYEALSEALKKTLAARDGMQGALNVIAAIKDESIDALAAALANLEEASAGQRAVTKARDTLQSPEAKRIVEQIEEIEADIELYRNEIVELIEPKLKELGEQDVKLQVALNGDIAAHRKLIDEEEQLAGAATKPPLAPLVEILSSSDTIEAARQRVAVAAELPAQGRDPVAALADVVAAAKADAEPLPRLAEESVRRGRNGYIQFVADHVGAAPLTDPDDVAIFRWCRLRERQLEDDELRRYREEFAAAREKMELDLTEGLINRLSDKFKTARTQIDRLNRSLAGRHFTGQTYAFRHSVSPTMKPIHALAEAIADAHQRGLAMLQDDDLDPRVREGFKELERRLSNDDLIKELRDYRRFFDFELYMTNERGQETTLSKRSATGSGGQKQAPYYVAVGAAMASAYYPKSTVGDPDGLGLVVFDEAFNNLDAPNTRALLDFFHDLHLQVIVAAPDKVRAMFLETIDTIVSVNRRPDTQEPVVTITHPTQYARDSLSNINPVNLGVEAFRPESAAAE
jgi:energy-coupling factor transporter ATP-binding protein EcfA2